MPGLPDPEVTLASSPEDAASRPLPRPVRFAAVVVLVLGSLIAFHLVAEATVRWLGLGFLPLSVFLPHRVFVPAPGRGIRNASGQLLAAHLSARPPGGTSGRELARELRGSFTTDGFQ